MVACLLQWNKFVEMQTPRRHHPLRAARSFLQESVRGLIRELPSNYHMCVLLTVNR